MRLAPKIELTEKQRETLVSYARGRSTPQRLVERASIILRAADGQHDRDIGAALRIGRRTVARWRARFLALGIEGIEKDAPRRGRARKVSIDAVLEETAKVRPQGDRWSTRTMAQALGISEASVRRVWRAHGVTPHRIRTCSFAAVPRFVRALGDVAGLYLEPPAFAVAFSTKERSVLASSGSRHVAAAANAEVAAMLPELEKLAGTAALRLRPPSGDFDWIGFLQLVERRTPRNQRLHVVASGYDPARQSAIVAWLQKHRRIEIHMAPAGTCWASLIRMCLDSRKRKSYPMFRAVPDLLNSLRRHTGNSNLSAPFSWASSNMVDTA